MPTEKRDSYSGALLFVPTKEEKDVRRLKTELQKELDSIKEWKKKNGIE